MSCLFFLQLKKEALFFAYAFISCMLNSKQLKQKKKQKKKAKPANHLDNMKEQTEGNERRREISLWPCTTWSPLPHKRKCSQQCSPVVAKTEIEKGNSEFVHLGKTSHWRQSISSSMPLKRARRKYSSSQHKRSWHIFQSIGYSQCAG